MFMGVEEESTSFMGWSINPKISINTFLIL